MEQSQLKEHLDALGLVAVQAKLGNPYYEISEVGILLKQVCKKTDTVITIRLLSLLELLVSSIYLELGVRREDVISIFIEESNKQNLFKEKK